MTTRQLIIGGHALAGLGAAAAIWTACAGLALDGSMGPTVARVAPFASRLASCAAAPAAAARHLARGSRS